MFIDLLTDDSGTSRVHVLNSGPPPVSPTKRKHHEDSDCDEEQMNKMSRLLASQLYACLLLCYKAFAFVGKYFLIDMS